MADLAKLFAGEVRALRRDRGLTQVQLADRAGVSLEWVRRIEGAKAPAPSFVTIQQIADALSAHPSELFGGIPVKAEIDLKKDVDALDGPTRTWLAQGIRLMRSRRP